MRLKLSKSFVLSASAAVAWAAVIFLFSAQDGNESSGMSGIFLTALCNLFGYSPSESDWEIMSFCIRKAAHMTEFGLLGLLVLNALYRGFGSFKGIWIASFAAASAYAATDEIHQLFIPGRSGKFTDWMIDSTGILLWLSVACLIIRIISSRKANKQCNSEAK